MANDTYKTLITQVIQDFDKVYTALKNKKVRHDGDFLPESGDTGIATNLYGDLISQLYRVNKADNQSVSLVNGEIDFRANSTKTETTSFVISSGNIVTVSGLQPGYYDSSSLIEFELTGADGESGGKLQSISVTGATPTNSNITLVGGKYVVNASTGYLLSSVSVDKGSITLIDNLGQSKADGETVSVTTNAALAGSILLTTGAVEGTDYELTLSKSTAITGKITSSLGSESVTVPGYITGNGDITHTINPYDLSVLSTAEDNTTKYYIKRGNLDSIKNSLKGNAVTQGTVTVTKPTGVNVSNASNTYADNYAITLSTAKGTTKLDIAAGYYEGATNVEVETGATEMTAYIKAGSITETVGTPDIAKTSTAQIKFTETVDSTKYQAAFNREAFTHKVDVVDGYVTADKAIAETTITAGKTYYATVDKGSAKIQTSAASNVTTTDSDEILAVSGGYAVTVGATFNNAIKSGTFKEGYFTEDDITAEGYTYSRTLNIKSATPSLTNVLNIKHNDADDYDEENGASLAHIFHTTNTDITGRDYWTIDATATLAALDGYVKSNKLEVAPTTKYYLPRATLKYIVQKKGEETGASFLQVEQAGYLPSGTLLDIAEVTGTIEYAKVSVGAAAGHGLVLDSKAENAYTITLAKGNVDAGYISQTAGEGLISGSFKIAHSKVNTTAAITKVEANIASPLTANSGVYSIPVVITGEANSVLDVEGYIKSDDVIVAEMTGKTQNVEIAAGSVNLTDAEIAATVKSDVINLNATAATGYAIDPILDATVTNGSEVAWGANKAGYIGTDYTGKANVSLKANSGTKYVLKGTATTITDSAEATLTSDFATKESGDYTISFSETVDINKTVAEGYYLDANAERKITGSITVSGSTTVDRGKVTVSSVTVKPDVNIEGMAFVAATNKVEGEEYYEIKSTIKEGSNATLGKTVTQGYVKEGDFEFTATTVGVQDAGTYYVAKYTTEKDQALNSTEKTVFNPFEGGTFGETYTSGQTEYEDVVLIPTAQRYSEGDIVVRLNSKACGSEVRTELDALAARLAGKIS